jgi:poly-gamma-glutamate synthase PgsB/CapB
MALDPALQEVTERQMIRATIGVITNVRLDHTEVMGRDLPSIAATLASSIPAHGVLVTNPSAFVPLFRKRAETLGTRIVVADAAAGADGGHERWLAEDTALALAVARQLGIDDAVARRGFARAPRDPGAVHHGLTRFTTGEVAWLDATAANDPESLALLLEDFEPWHTAARRATPARPRILVYHHRPDRVPRLECFAVHSPAFAATDSLVISGARPPLSVSRRIARTRTAGGPEFVATSGLAGWIAGRAPAVMVFCGNTRGLDVPRLFEEAVTRG